MMSKEEQQPMKACLHDSMRTDRGTEASGYSPTIMFFLREYSTDVTNIGLWSSSSREHSTNSICATTIFRESKKLKLDLALLASFSALLGKFLRCFVHTCTYNLATK